MSDEELAPFAVYRMLALYAPKAKLQAVSPWLVVPALALRSLALRPELEAMSSREVFALLIDRTKVGEDWPEQLTISKRHGSSLFASLGPHSPSVPVLRLEGSQAKVAVSELVATDRWALRARLGTDVLHPSLSKPEALLEEAARWLSLPASSAWWDELAPDHSPTTTKRPGRNGRLAAEVVQSTVRANFFPLRLCYEDGLVRNPELEGRIAVRFVIERSGRATVASAESDIPDNYTTECIKSVFSVLVFPKPEGGIVTVTYPIKFSPG